MDKFAILKDIEEMMECRLDLRCKGRVTVCDVNPWVFAKFTLYVKEE